MAKYRIQSGAEIDVVSTIEHEAAMHNLRGSITHDFFQELARGVKPVRFLGFGTVDGSGDLLINGSPGTSDGLGGPEQGMTWAIRRLSVTGLGTNDVLKIYRSVVDPANYIGSLTAAASRAGFGSTEFILLPSDQILISGTGLTATGQLVVNGEGIEVPSFMVSKLL